MEHEGKELQQSDPLPSCLRDATAGQQARRASWEVREWELVGALCLGTTGKADTAMAGHISSIGSQMPFALLLASQSGGKRWAMGPRPC